MLVWLFQALINVATRRLNNSDLNIRKPKFSSTLHELRKLARYNKISK